MREANTRIKKQCLNCNKSFFVGSDWNNPPSICEFCRAKKVKNIIGKLNNYLQKREKIKHQAGLTSSDKKKMIDDNNLRAQIKYILFESHDDENYLINKLISDKQIRKLILRLDKESRINERSRKRHVQQSTGTTAITGKLHFVQGGSPGQGKKS